MFDELRKGIDPAVRSGGNSLFDAHDLLGRGRDVVRAGRDALGQLERALDHTFVAACETIFAGGRQLVVTGIGKSGHIARKVAATFAATGTPAIFIHPSEAAHGDMGNLVPGDVLLVFSNSGKTSELRPMLDYARAVHVPIIGVASRGDSPLIRCASVGIVLPHVREACAVNVAPTTSTTVQLALGDALAMAVMDMRGETRDAISARHPGGNIGLELIPIGDIALGADRMPLVAQDCAMRDVVTTITRSCCGIAGVVNAAGQLVGVITDGDLRRNFERLHQCRAIDVATMDPRVVGRSLPAIDVLRLLNARKITSVFVVEDGAIAPARPLGIVHVHDLLRLGLG
ncbi:KpsF/GutQ family sugar-phosphate isomerase [Novosphingobium sp.]|uniref:KpsF/GutQ family sugar-phosphate isomerase n=1 Tax=Novosphingobium sp. TaxID=1874826 RepID=UPI003B5180D6